MKKTITLNNKKRELLLGLRKVKDLYQELSLGPDSHQLYLLRSSDIKIPLLPDDYIMIHGEENISSDKLSNKKIHHSSTTDLVHITFNGEKVKEGLKKAKMTGKELCHLDKELENALLFVHSSEQVDIAIQNDWTLIIQVKDFYFTIPFDEKDTVDLEKCAKANRQPPKGQRFYKIKIDGEKYKVKKQKMKGSEILGLAGKTYDEWSLNQKFHSGRRKPIEPNETIDFSLKGIERFETVIKQAQQGIE